MPSLESHTDVGDHHQGGTGEKALYYQLLVVALDEVPNHVRDDETDEAHDARHRDGSAGGEDDGPFG